MQLPADYPPVLYVPTAAVVARPDDAQLEYRKTKDGRKALLAYSALDRLHAGMGATQPWLVLPTVQLETVWEADKFDTVLLDVEIPPEHRNGPEGVAARAAMGAEGESERDE
ncbi:MULTISPECIES: SAV_915 family protein [Demequina]|uniref:SAV_915 family protein n=1 Tax=Demequina TaxID=577469 RepID=UPI000AE8A44B|nr:MULTISPECIES: SAV_915 family protein [Demequina]